MPFDLDDKVVVITGGSRGLGRAMAVAFSEQGASVLLASRDPESCRATAEEISARTGGRVIGRSLHVGRWGTLDSFVADTVTELGRIDVLINNAGMSPLYEKPSDVSEELFDKVIDVNLKGPFRLSTLVAEEMVAAGSGSIINITSMGAVRPRPHILPYAAAKAGLNALTVGLAHAYGPTVRVNAIMAGTFFTDASQAWDEGVFAERAKSFALGRGGRAEEIVGAALYLASPLASYTTGSVLTVDGGQP